jgi:hypothetical protein
LQVVAVVVQLQVVRQAVALVALVAAVKAQAIMEPLLLERLTQVVVVVQVLTMAPAMQDALVVLEL